MQTILIILAVVSLTRGEVVRSYHRPEREFRHRMLLPLQINHQPQTLYGSPPSNQHPETAFYQQHNNLASSGTGSQQRDQIKYAVQTENRNNQPQNLPKLNLARFRGHLMQHQPNNNNNNVIGRNFPQLNYGSPPQSITRIVNNRGDGNKVNVVGEPQRVYGPPNNTLETFDRLKQTNLNIPTIQYLPVLEPMDFDKITSTTPPAIDVRHSNLNANVVIQKAEVKKLNTDVTNSGNVNEFDGNVNGRTRYLPPSTTEMSFIATTASTTTTTPRPVVKDNKDAENVPNVAIATSFAGNLYLLQPNGQLQKLQILQSNSNVNNEETPRSNQLLGLYALPFYNFYILQ